MSAPARYEAALRRVLWELRPYLDQLVLVGGWVPHLYHRYGGFASWRSRLSLTIEVDLFVERTMQPGARPSIAQLLRGSGFVPQGGAGGLAVWSGDVRAGEKVEFLVHHTGTARQLGSVVSIPAQPGLGGISLPGLEVMTGYKRTLRIPLPGEPGNGVGALEIWVPKLGAYVVNKALTYGARGMPEPGGDPKAGKDLLYVRDLFAAGAEVVGAIGTDLAEIAAGRVEDVRRARDLLARAVEGTPHRDAGLAAAMLAEREAGVSIDAALADVRGYLADALELLDEALRGAGGLRRRVPRRAAEPASGHGPG